MSGASAADSRAAIGKRTYVHDVLELFDGYADREALVGGDRRLTYREVRAGVLDMAGALRAHGVAPGDAVLVMVANAVEAPILHLALHLLGCRAMWAAPVTARREVEEFVRLSAPDAFVYDARGHAALGGQVSASLAADGRGDRPVLCLGPGGLGPDLAAGPPAAPAGTPAGYDLGAPVPEPDSFLQTSGTTGTPKLVHHREGFYRQVMALARDFVAAGFPPLRHLSHSPMWLASGQITTLFNLFTGGVLYLRDDWDPARFLETVERERINSTFVSPPMLYELLDHSDLPGADCGSLFMFNVGAGPAAPARLRQAIDRFGPVLRIVYGLSEVVVITAQPQLAYDPAHPERLASCGRPYGDVRVEIRDERGTVLGPGVDGEVWVASALAFAGYHGLPELTAETIVDGWVRTRDIGHLDEDGYLYLVDRAHDMIVTHRRNWAIFCRPIEDVLAGHPGVRAAAVIGVPDDVVGEVPHAFVVAGPTSGDAVTPTVAELIGLVTTELNEMWAPKDVTFLDRLPLNRSNKVDKRALRDLYARGAGARG
jgi:acyl-CoA synthetase (AMP-forming)/AMP-acid ligase II